MSESTWQVRFSRSKQLPYFFNTSTQESIWTRPEGMGEDEARGLVGGKEYLGQGQGQAGGQQQQQQGGQQDKVRASHLLIKHSGSRRPASWKNPHITTPKHLAIDHLTSLQTHLLTTKAQGQDLAAEFAKLAARESDCASHAKGGDLGWFGRGSMQKPFEDATFDLEPGQMSGIVDTDSGVHLILRTG